MTKNSNKNEPLRLNVPALCLSVVFFIGGWMEIGTPYESAVFLGLMLGLFYLWIGLGLHLRWRD